MANVVTGEPKVTKGKKTTDQVIELPALTIRRMVLTIVGDSELIMHRWSDKAKKEMLDKQMKKARQAKEAKDPKKDYEESMYVIGDRKAKGAKKYGFPAVAFKKAAVDACSHISGVTKVVARGAFHIDGELVHIKGKPRMREDMVKIFGGTADIRYRGGFPQWSATFEVRYNEKVISAEQVINLFNTAGFAIGIGEWRPQRDGVFGMFHVEEES